MTLLPRVAFPPLLVGVKYYLISICTAIYCNLCKYDTIQSKAIFCHNWPLKKQVCKFMFFVVMLSTFLERRTFSLLGAGRFHLGRCGKNIRHKKIFSIVSSVFLVCKKSTQTSCQFASLFLVWQGLITDYCWEINNKKKGR